MGKSTLRIHKINLDDLPLEFRYYSIKVNYNYEREASKNIRNNMIARGFGDHIDDIIIPIIEREETKLNKAGKAITKIKYDKIFGLDGYIWLKMILNSETWSVVRNSTGVAGWVNSDGPHGRPMALTDNEVLSIKKAIGLLEIEKKAAAENFKANFGDLIKIIDGPMLGLEGMLAEINKEKKTVKLQMPNGMSCQAEFYQVQRVE